MRTHRSEGGLDWDVSYTKVVPKFKHKVKTTSSPISLGLHLRRCDVMYSLVQEPFLGGIQVNRSLGLAFMDHAVCTM
jgi:hypothetical protein